MKNVRGNRSLVWRYKEKSPTKLSITYDWRGMMDMKPEDVKYGTTPHFVEKKGCYSIEDWSLEMIRRKFFKVLKDAKDYERDRWMPKALLMIHYIMTKEVVNLYDLALFLGMPRHYLSSLCRRDKGFRNWIISLRNQDKIKVKAYMASQGLLGETSYLNKIQPHWTGKGDRVKPYTNPIDVGWTGKTVSKKR